MSLHCPICASAAAEDLDFRPEVPIAQNLLFRSERKALACPVATLRMVRCMVCGFAWNAAFDPALLVYGADYENDQSHSPVFGAHLDAVATHIGKRMAGLRDVAALELGCGQGDFLHRLARVFEGRLRDLAGFDPAYRPGSPIPGGARIEPAYFTEESAALLRTAPDLLVTRHVVEHVADPLSFLRAMRSVCAEGVPLFVETPSVQWIVDEAAAHDLYYEHCSLFDAGSLRLALELSGFAVEEVSACFGGQYLLATAVAAADVAPALPVARPSNADYPARKAGASERLAAALERDAAAGERVALWGGASKSVTLALLLPGEQRASISAAIDVNPVRSGTFMPVTALPVISPDAAQAAGVTKAYVVNPQYLSEIEILCSRRGWPLRLAIP
ncbi:MAG TPA: class I SAM-dependent methyltransferase [Allosphingosinicella sp.]|nr:class I SAM-dependent methyltransferase [Allosphingosinicella sp.]